MAKCDSCIWNLGYDCDQGNSKLYKKGGRCCDDYEYDEGDDPTAFNDEDLGIGQDEPDF